MLMLMRYAAADTPQIDAADAAMLRIRQPCSCHISLFHYATPLMRHAAFRQPPFSHAALATLRRHAFFAAATRRYASPCRSRLAITPRHCR